MNKTQVFISYCHKNDDERQELDKWLVNLKDKELIDSWFDGNLIPGDQFMGKISKKMDKADIIILMLSQDYLASKACKEEMNYALKSLQKKTISIILKDCTWLETDCKDLIALPKNGKPISRWNNKEEGWQSVYDGIKRAVNELQYNFVVKAEFLKDLQQIEFATQGNRGANLENIFVFPNINFLKDAFKTEKVEFDFFLEKKRKSILIKGREFSGKSALLKWLFLNLREKYSPIILNGGNIHKSINFDKYLEKEFSSQMNGDFNTWMKKDNKVALIDNFSHNISHNIIEYLNHNFTMTILAVDDEEHMLYFKDEPSFSDYATISIGQFDFVQQEKLIRKWFQASQQITQNEINDLNIDKLESQVNTVITTQRIVPRYPFYILSILQSLETFMPSGIRITAYGHCYMALVTAQLVKKNIKPDDIDTCFNYLRNLSHDIYIGTSNGDLYTSKHYNLFRDAYKSKYIISDALINKMENDDYSILDIQDDYAKFEHSYIYYFFLGMYLAFDENEKIINHLCENIHLRENAFVLIFTIHHTQNKVLLDTIRLHCMVSFEKIKPAVLDTAETRFMNNLLAELPQSIISNKSTEINRTEERKNKKEAINEKDDYIARRSTENQEDNVSQIELNRGIKIMEVLGQILKNRAGSFDKKDVEEILENTVDLGLRILNLLLSECRKPDFEEWLTKMLNEKEKWMEETQRRKFDDQKRKEFIEKLIQFFGYIVTVGMLNRISEAITTEKLTSIMSMLAEKKMTPAYELINYLVSSSQNGANANHIKGLLAKYGKSKNYWAEKVLSHYVQGYLNTHNINYKDRQKLFAALNLKYLPNKNQ